ncbi:hypothetical protein [Brevibacillus sp. SYSU BS000544]|uniref:hypothetical protein n=1 Tax=Brevibacillus sp. SYSU BS000544 TaxID=3416443 RepID=UPI003CE4D93F
MIYLAVFLITIISFKDLRLMIKRRLNKELVFFSLVTIMNLTYAVLIMFDVEPYSPQDFTMWLGDTLFPSKK